MATLKNTGSTSRDLDDLPKASSCDVRPFPFEQLPKEIRLMVYDHLIGREYRPLLEPKVGLCYLACDIDPSLLRLSSFFRQEVGSYLRVYLQSHPIVLLCRQRVPKAGALDYARQLVRLVERGHNHDNLSRKGMSDAHGTSKEGQFDRFTLKMSMFAFEADMRRLTFARDGSIAPFYGPALQSFYQSALLKLRGDPSSETYIHCMLRGPLTLADESNWGIKKRVDMSFGDFKLRHRSSRFVTVLCRDTKLASIQLDMRWKANWWCLVKTPTEEEESVLRIKGRR